VIEGFDDILEISGQPELVELRDALRELLGGPAAKGRLIGLHRLAPGVYRVRLEADGRVDSLIVKRLEARIAQRSQLVTSRWLPAVGLGQAGPPLRRVVAERGGWHTWHVYDDLGDWELDEQAPNPEHVGVAVELIAQVHTRFAGHPLLPQCRLHGGDLGGAFFTASVRDAIHSLESLRTPRVKLPPEALEVRNRLLERLNRLLGEGKARAMPNWGGLETLLHGDLWPKNVLVVPTGDGLHARLIDWDRTGVGPFYYDLSMFLGRFPASDRLWILDRYRQAVGRHGWRLPSTEELNRLFDTAERARLANCVIWRALAVWEGPADWALAELASLDQWLGALQPVLPPG
jgi:hypothetical protein